MLICVLLLDMSDVGDFYGRYICGDQGIVEVDHHIFAGQTGLDSGYIDVCNGLAAVKRLADGCTGCLSG